MDQEKSSPDRRDLGEQTSRKTNGEAVQATAATMEMGDVRRTSKVPATSAAEKRRSGFSVTLIHFIKGNIGCGMLAMGQAFKLGGLLLTPCILVYVWLICVYNMHVLTTLSKKVQNRLQSKHAQTFGDTVENSFKMSDKWIFRFMSNGVRKIVLYNILITQLGLCSVYILFISETLHEVLNQYICIDNRIVLMLTMPLIMVCASLRKLRFIAPLSTLANVALFTGVITIMYHSCSNLKFEGLRLTYDKLSDLPTMFGIIMFSFEGIGLVLPLFAEIKDDKKFTSCFGVLNFGMVAVMMLNVSLGTTGYMSWGDKVASSLTKNLPAESKLIEFVRVMMILGIACSYALQFYPAATIVYGHLESNHGPFNRPALWDYCVRLCICLVTYLAASTVPHLDLFMSLIGSVTCVALTMIFPALSNLAFRTKGKGSALSTLVDVVTLLTAVVGSVTGIYANSTAIYEKFTGGYGNEAAEFKMCTS